MANFSRLIYRKLHAGFFTTEQIPAIQAPAKYVKNVTFLVWTQAKHREKFINTKILPTCPSASFVTKKTFFSRSNCCFLADWWNRILVQVWNDNLWSMEQRQSIRQLIYLRVKVLWTFGRAAKNFCPLHRHSNSNFPLFCVGFSVWCGTSSTGKNSFLAIIARLRLISLTLIISINLLSPKNCMNEQN